LLKYLSFYLVDIESHSYKVLKTLQHGSRKSKYTATHYRDGHVWVGDGYHHKNGLSYYQSTRDASTHFFIDELTKGNYVLEYEVRLNNIGTFTSGISSIQSMYAPEHSRHSNSQTIKVK